MCASASLCCVYVLLVICTWIIELENEKRSRKASYLDYIGHNAVAKESSLAEAGTASAQSSKAFIVTLQFEIFVRLSLALIWQGVAGLSFC